MRIKYTRAAILFLTIFVLMILRGSSQTPVAAQSSSVERAAMPLGAALRLIVVTDDDFLSEEGDAWCAGPLTRAVEEFQRVRPDADLAIQTRFAGAPAILRGGRSQTGPRRAIGLLCDAENAVLGFFVGVPTGRQLRAMVEDTDEISVLSLTASLQDVDVGDDEAEQKDLLIDALYERSRPRVLRHYKPLLEKINAQTPLAVAATRLLPALAAERRERFLVADPSDTLRWLSAQQHAETMRHWCEAMLPSVVGKPADSVWPELTAIVWDAQPWTLRPDDSDLISWYRRSIATGPVVLSVDFSARLVDQPPAPAMPFGQSGLAAVARERSQPQRDALLAQVSDREAGLVALAVLMHDRQDPPIDVLGKPEALPRWVVFESEDKGPVFVPPRSERRLADIIGKTLARE